MAERCANWAGEIAVAAFCWVWGVLATMARKLSIVRGTAVANWAAFALPLKFFGTDGDKVTTKSGFDACSFGKFTMTHDYGCEVNEDLLTAPGVIDVKINFKLKESSEAAVQGGCVRSRQEKVGCKPPWSI